jgi:branched-chain amino acid transport system permease protein
MDWAILGQQLWDGLVFGSIYILFACGLTLAYGNMDIINLAHGEFLMLAGVLSYSIMTLLHVSFLISSAIAVVLVTLFGWVFNRVAIQPLLKISPIAVLVSTFGLSFLLVNGAFAFWSLTPKKILLPIGGVQDLGGIVISNLSIIIVSIAVIVIAGFYIWLQRAGIGKAIRATAQNRMAASLLGINTMKMYDLTMMISAGLSGLAGILAAMLWSVHAGMGQSLLLIGLVIAIVGGLGNMNGTIIMGLFVAIGEALFGQYVSIYYKNVFIYGIMILVILYKPQGLFARR